MEQEKEKNEETFVKKVVQTALEAEIQILGFMENHHRKQNTIDGFQVVAQVNGESRQALKGLHLQGEHPHRAERGQHKEVEEIEAWRHNRLNREEMKVDRQNRAHDHEACQNLVEQKGH